MIARPCLRYLALELTNVCNMKCSKCWSQSPQLQSARPKGFMDPELFKAIMTELDEYFPTRQLTVGLNYDGESTLHPQFELLAREAAKRHFKQLQLATNGTRLNKHLNSVLLDNFTSLAVSVHHGADVKMVLRKAKELYHQREGLTPRIRINMVAEEFTQDEINHIAAEIQGHTDEVKLISYITEDMQSAMPHGPYWPDCPSLWMYLAVLWNGDALPCCHILSPGPWTLGNVAVDGLRKVFGGRPFQALRHGETEGTLCHSCQVRR